MSAPGAPVPVRPAPGSRLDQLATLHPVVKAARVEAETREAEVTDAIKAELALLHPDGPSVLYHPALPKPLRMAPQTSWRLDTAKLKTGHPEVYAAYARQSTTWVLRAVEG